MEDSESMTPEEALFRCLSKWAISLKSAMDKSEIRKTIEMFLVQRAEKKDDSSSETVTRASLEPYEMPDHLLINTFIEGLIKTNDKMKIAVKEVASFRKDSKTSRAEYEIAQALRVLTFRAMNGEMELPVPDEELKKIAGELTAELVTGRRTYDVISPVTGILIDEPLDFGDSFSIKKFQEDEAPRRTPIFSLLWQRMIPSENLQNGETIIQFLGESSDGGDLQNRLREILALLRLYRIGSYYARIVFLHPRSLIQIPYSAGSSYHPIQLINARFTKKDIERFLDVERIYAPILHRVNEVGETSLGSLEIALSRYDASLLESTRLEMRIVNAVSALEALLLTDNDELSYKLRTRTALLVGSLRNNQLDVRRKVGKSYSIRSKYLHGNKVEISPAELNHLSLEILEIAREALLLSLVLIPKLTHKKFIELIDDALVDTPKRGEFTLLVSDIGEIFEQIHSGQ